MMPSLWERGGRRHSRWQGEMETSDPWSCSLLSERLERNHRVCDREIFQEAVAHLERAEDLADGAAVGVTGSASECGQCGGDGVEEVPGGEHLPWPGELEFLGSLEHRDGVPHASATLSGR